MYNFKEIIFIVCAILNGIQLLLLASFSNPYIASFDSIFLLFLPIYVLHNVKDFIN
jgi:hypothetical protein